MPPGAKLSEEDVSALTEWIARGAVWGKPLKLPQETVRLQPTAFRELPRNLARELQKLGCTIPQISGAKEPHNVIRGEFATTGQNDWAVLCYKDGASTLLVSITNHMSQNIAPIPLLWVVPLAIYLLTFILAFSS